MENDTAITPPVKKDWWQSELIKSDGMSDGQSYSDQWRDQLGIHRDAADFDAKEDDVRSKLKAAARKLARTVNVLRNASDEETNEERRLRIVFSDGNNTNKPNSNDIVLSPNLLIGKADASVLADSDEELPDEDEVIEMEEDEEGVVSAKPPMEEGKAMDVLTGQVLMLQSMKRTASTIAFAEAVHAGRTNEPFWKETRELWQSVEQAVARADVLREWQGFEPYFHRHAQETGANYEAVQKYIDGTAAETPTLKAAVLCIAWNLLHPKSPVKIPRIYGEVVEAGLDKLDKCMEEKKKRYQHCKAAVELMAMLVDTMSKSAPESEPGSGAPGGGEHSSSGAMSGGTSHKGPSAPKAATKERTSSEEGAYEGPTSDPSEDASGGTKEEETTGGGGAEEEAPAEAAPDPGSITDGSLFGETVESEVKAEALPEATTIEESEEREVKGPTGLEKIRATVIAHCETEESEYYAQYVRVLTPQIKAIANALHFRNNEEGYMVRGQVSGDLDDGNLYKLRLDADNPPIWQRKEHVTIPKIAVGLLVDESGSMSGVERSEKLMPLLGKGAPVDIGVSRVEDAKRVCIAMYEALKKVKGIDIMVLGHTANTSPENGRYLIDFNEAKQKMMSTNLLKSMRFVGKRLDPARTHADLVIHEYWTKNHKRPYQMAYMGSFANNYDGYAMDYSIRKMADDFHSHPIKLLFVISDGMPSGTNYNGSGAEEHMNKVVQFGSRCLGVETFGIGIANAYDNKAGKCMYGQGRFVVLKDVASSVSVLTAFLTQIARKL